jgi:hypothetical protein
MSLHWHDSMLLALRNYRTCWLGGRYGGGKTAISFRLAHDLVKDWGFRYIVSNCRSVWNTSADKVELRDGRFVDAVIILDEGGMFLDSTRLAKEWLAYLRKLNIILIVPSVLPPALILRRMVIQRTFNFQPFGLPVWRFTWKLDNGMTQQKDHFWWVNFSEIFGIYDTLGMPSEASYILGFMETWTTLAGKSLGYNARTKGQFNRFDFTLPSSSEIDSDVMEDNTEMTYDASSKIFMALEKLNAKKK